MVIFSFIEKPRVNMIYWIAAILLRYVVFKFFLLNCFFCLSTYLNREPHHVI